ncbi:histone H2A-like [Centroberyx affinis]|uniref:histone H2A-like n=1 Tax=Centroberyx affinis TaxID=166261 RepID=UPI003A5BD7CF
MSGHGKKAVPKSKSTVTQSSGAGFAFSIGRIHRLLRKGNYAKRVDTGAAVYLAAILEYLCAEILDVAGSVSRAKKKQQISSQCLLLVVKNDEELHKLFGGVLPNIQANLLSKKTKMSTDDGVAKEEELNKLLAGVTISEEGTLPNIETSLLSKTMMSKEDRAAKDALKSFNVFVM